MRPLAALSMIALAGCASSASNPAAQPGTQQTVRIANTGSNSASSLQMITEDSPVATTSFAQPVDAVWRALPLAYDSLSIPVTTRDAATHVVGNPSFKARRKLGSVGLGRYFDCGMTQGAPSADTYEVVVSVVTSAQQAGTGTTIATRVDAQARPVSFSSDYIRCSSKGTLEQQIAEKVKAILK